MRHTTPALSRDMAWTARQREVLDLLAQGKTNPEIASALDISLAGAKWHVSEVLSRPGVGSREEAADWWRAQRRSPLRLHRVLGLLVASSLARGAAVAAVLGVSIATVAVAIQASGGGDAADDPAQQASPTPASTPRPAGAIFTWDDARVRAYELAQAEIDGGRRPWDAVRIAGRKIRSDDLFVADEQFVSNAQTVRSRASPTEWRGGQGENVWAFTLERTGLDMPGSDGRVNGFIIFEDGTGLHRSGSLGGPSPRDLPDRPRPVWDTAVTLGSVMVGGKEWILKGQLLADGTQCFLYNDPRIPSLGATSGGCGDPLLENWPFTLHPAVEPGVQVFRGAGGNGVERIRLNFADGSTQMVEPKAMPPELPFGVRYFVIGIEGEIDVLTADGLTADGAIVYTQALGPWGDRGLAVPQPMEAQQSMDGSGNGQGRTREIKIKPPPAIQRLFVRFTHAGTDHVSVDFVCGSQRTTVINHLRPEGSFDIGVPVDVPSAAATCHFEVTGIGVWTLRAR